MIHKVEYDVTNLNNDLIATNSFYNQLMKTGNINIINNAIDFYSSNILNDNLRYSAYQDKIISIKK